MNATVTDALLEATEKKTRAALDKIKAAPPARSHLRRLAEDFRKMAEDYYRDAQHFRQKGEKVLAFEALVYGYAWLDSGARLGLFDVGGDDQLFTLAE